MQQEVVSSLEDLTPQVELIQRLRAASRYDQKGMLADLDKLSPQGDFSQTVKDALSHYWGGPKLTESPLLRLQVVQRTLEDHDNNPVNALRSILREAIEQVRPEGDRRFTGEWILYNILEMKFMEGRKVREVAMRLAVSEADLYRKQKVAIEAVANGLFSDGDGDRFQPLLNSLLQRDEYFVTADFAAYQSCQQEVDEVWSDRGGMG